jgi:hypothetical protein
MVTVFVGQAWALAKPAKALRAVNTKVRLKLLDIGCLLEWG